VIDGVYMEAYVAKCMSIISYRSVVLLTVLAVCASTSFSEDLDAALEAQKKKAQRHVYSDSALLTDQKLIVPRTPTEEEKDLDKKLREMDAERERTSSGLPLVPRPVAPASRSADDKNWLTPAMLDNDSSMTQTNEDENAWLLRELERQKERKVDDAVKKDEEKANKLLREKINQQSNSPEQERLKQYQLAPPKLFGSRGKEKEDPNTPSYMVPNSGTPDPLTAIRLTPKKEKLLAPAIFSPEAARISSGLDKDPLKSTRSSVLNPGLGGPLRPSSAPSVFSPRRDVPKTAPLTPLEMIKKSSPINRPDPFVDDRTHPFKTSIWE
jgi:hypothetical protein